MRWFAALMFGLFLLLVPGHGPSQAQNRVYCPLPEDGAWVNPEAKPKELIRLEVESKCANNTVTIRARAFTKCVPRDCKWGWTKAEYRDGGGVRVLLSGFFGSKLIDMRRFGDRLDVFLTDIAHDRAIQDKVSGYVMQRP